VQILRRLTQRVGAGRDVRGVNSEDNPLEVLRLGDALEGMVAELSVPWGIRQ